MIEFEGVGKSFGGVAAVEGLDLRIEGGECVVLLGPSGCGKSTTLKLANRLLECDRGVVRFHGRDVRAVTGPELRRQMGYAIQSIGLFPHWSVARNVATVPALLGWAPARIEARVDELLALLGLPPAQFRARYPHELSGGQQQRVGVARALAADPDVLLMDEPFGALDPLTRKALQQELLRIHRSLGKTILLVTHDVEEALELATRVVLLRAGRIVQQARPRELLRSPADSWVAQFLGGAEIGLRLLALATVAEHFRAAAIGDAALVPGPTPGQPLRLSASLRDALSEFASQRCEVLPVADETARIVGALHLADVIRA